ncbi:MAG: protein-export chaperone SecB [Thiotrichaceae bacterium]|nr:protein-export chaperone SecB [Thiotrichaceae bacterium]
MTEENQPKTQAVAATTEANEQRFVIHRIYIKDVSFESPSSPTIFTEQWEPTTDLQMNTEVTSQGDNFYEVKLELTVTVKSDEKTAFLIEVTQAGVFEIAGYSKEEMNHILSAYCPSILFPYAREVVSSHVAKGSFPELHLAPINFDALYAQRLEEESQQAATKEA